MRKKKDCKIRYIFFADEHFAAFVVEMAYFVSNILYFI